MSEEEREEFINIMRKLSSNKRIISMDTKLPEEIIIRNTLINEAKEDGKIEGKLEGIKLNQEETVKNLLSLKVSKDIISKATGLSMDAISKLASTM